MMVRGSEFDTTQTITATVETRKAEYQHRPGRLNVFHHNGVTARPRRKTVVVRATLVSVVWNCKRQRAR
jgi:hypothetical protein